MGGTRKFTRQFGLTTTVTLDSIFEIGSREIVPDLTAQRDPRKDMEAGRQVAEDSAGSINLSPDRRGIGLTLCAMASRFLFSLFLFYSFQRRQQYCAQV